MQRVKTSTAIAVLPADPAGGTPGYFAQPNPVGGVPATQPSYEWYNNVQEEIVSIILAGGGTLDGANRAQMLAALRSAGVFTTPAQFDNSTKAATTAFVQQALGNKSASAGYVSATANLSAADAGKALYFSGAASVVNLPAISTVADGATFSIQTSVPLTVNRNGADVIAANGGTQTSLSLQVNSTVVITKSSAINAWLVDGSARLLYDGNFASSLAASGYQKLPSGLIIQWGQTGNIAANSSQAIAFPIAFPVGVKSLAMANAYAAASATITASIGAAFSGATTGFTACNLGTVNNSGAGWIAIGW